MTDSPVARALDASDSETVRASILPGVDLTPRSITVAIPGRPIEVGMARNSSDYEQAFALLAINYQTRGYDSPDAPLCRFTPFHILPSTTTFVAKDGARIVATFSLVADTRLLGLPMESIFAPEVDSLRREGRRLGEVTSLADRDLSPREFLPVFMALIRFMLQYHLRQGGDTWALTVNPRHAGFYRKVMGAIQVGSRQSYPSVNDHPAEAYYFDPNTLLANVPGKHDQFFAEPIADSILAPPPRSPDHARVFADRANLGGQPIVEEVLRSVALLGSPPRWLESADDA